MCSINHEKKAIFIHIPKTAGIYVRETLSKNYGFELFCLKRPDHIKFCGTNLKLNKNQQLSFCNKTVSVLDYYKTSKDLSDLMDMDEEKWNTYYKFCFIRNPYDRIVSAWNYTCQTEKLNISFSKYLKLKDIVTETEYFHVFFPQSKQVFNDKNEIAFDFIGKYENLEDDLKKILITIGFKEDEITHNKNPKNKRPHKSNNILINSQETLEIVNEICKSDFERLDYEKITDFANL